MAERNPEISGSSIVLRGSFNPAIFQPAWFAQQNLLAQAEAEASELKIVHPQISSFETERFVLQITTDRFVAASKPNASSEPLRDLVVGTFFILEHTPVTAIGLNRQLHFPMKSEDEWHRLGDKLAPKDGWNGVLEGRPGMRSLDILTYNAQPAGSSMMVRVQPSVLVKFGAYFETNEQYLAPNNEPLKALMQILRERWEEAQRYASKIANHILDWANN